MEWKRIRKIYAGGFAYLILLVIERKNGDVDEIELNALSWNLKKIAAYIDGYSGRRLYDAQKTKRKLVWRILIEVGIVLLVILCSVFLK